MKTTTLAVFGILGALFLGAVMLIGAVISTSNQEIELRTAIEAKQKDNTSEFDNMWKVISQTAQVSESQKDALKEIFVGYADARSGNDKGGSLANWIKEACPNVNLSTYNNLQNIIVSKRDAWTMRQKEILDMGREHTTLMRRFPSGFILGLLGRKEIPIQIVTSSRTEKSFETGKDDDVNLFNKK